MKASDRAILIGVVALGAIAAFWFMVLAPKRADATKLGDDIAAVREEISVNEAVALAGEQAQDGYSESYRSLVVLGKAVPQDEDTASLLLSLEKLSNASDVEFRGLLLQGAGDTEAAAVAAPPPLVEPGTTQEEAEAPPAEGAAAEGAAATGVPTAATPTEAVAAALPIGATVGPAGLPIMPYTLNFQGGFFEIADFMRGVDDLVGLGAEQVDVEGRLLTVDGFTMKPHDVLGFPVLDVDLAVTTFLTPADQGAVAGATVAGPETTPVATPAPPAPAPPAATVTP